MSLAKTLLLSGVSTSARSTSRPSLARLPASAAASGYYGNIPRDSELSGNKRKLDCIADIFPLYSG
ncbi:hypothetical protein E2C01_083233 [Portunus trituberculatus]|uniref:Uncharacterized protein n=1 Tax=Portunus trituberculatus TaxID=210409 RepID=A0A5B7IWN6_PORTR|nr:hypothetical protein [Portunus trituberculatus]